MTQVVRFWANIRRLGSSESRIEKIPVGFFIFGLHKQVRSFFRSKGTNLKLKIEPHRKQPQRHQRRSTSKMYVQSFVFAVRIEWRLLESRPSVVSSIRKTDQSHRRISYTADVFHFRKIITSSPDARSSFTSKWEIPTRFKVTTLRSRYKIWWSAGYHFLLKNASSCFGEHYWR